MSSKVYSFYLEGKPLCAKKCYPVDTLSKFRKILGSKINSNIIFLRENVPIEIEDENDFSLENIDNSGKIYLQQSTSNLNSYKVYLNEKYLSDYNGNENGKLIILRKKFENQIGKDFQFLMQNETQVEKEDEDGEDGFTIQDIQKDGIIYIISDNTQENTETEKNLQCQNNANSEAEKINNAKAINESKILYNFFLNNKKIYSSSFLSDSPLYSVRKEIKNKIENSQKLFFLHNSTIVTKEEEFELEIKDICEENIIFLTLDTPKEIKNIDPNKDEEEDITPFQEVKPKPGYEKPKNDNKFYFEIEHGTKFVKSFDPEENLSIIRVELKNQISDDIVFIYDGYEIDQSEEENYSLSLIQNNSKIYLRKKKSEKSLNEKSTELTAAPSLIKNEPIKGSKLICEKNGLKIYKFPPSTFTQEEEIRSISLMVVGQTGSGKTTLLNGFVNYLMGIQLEDDFRYKIIIEENDEDQSKSVTQNVTVYRISTNGKYPPIKIIDSPGYGDTGGIQRDIKITELIKQKFESEIDTINAICFVAQSSNARLTVNQRYIFDSIINLFGNDIAENFIVMMTFCDGQDPQLKDALISKESNLKPIISLIKYPWYLKFNNSAIFAPNKDKFNELFWRLGMESFDEFMKKLNLYRQNL